MLVIFKSKAAGSIIMYEENAKPILDLFGKEVKQGIITAAETGGAITRLEEEIARRSLIEAEEKAEREEKARLEEERSFGSPPPAKSEPVSFSARAFPLLDMLKRANKKDKDVVWGV
jgi:hypothetical protein